MRAVRTHGPRDYRLETLPVPRPGPGEVLLKVEACGICASDVKCFYGTRLHWGDGVSPGYVQTPVTAGHEFIGTVAALGEGAAERCGLQVGDRAISEQIVPCGRCRYCLTGRYWLCLVHDIYGFHTATHGGMADYMLFPAGALNYRVPPEIPLEQAALIEPLACSMHAVNRGQIALGDTVVIAGMGPLGLGMLACARLKNPGRLVVLDRSAQRLDLARRLGADIALHVDTCDPCAEVMRLTDGYGCDVFIEATGNPDAVNMGLQMITKGGRFVEFSVMARETSTDWTLIGDQKEITIYGAHLGPHCYPVVIDYLARGVLQVEGLVTHTLPLESFREGIEMVHDAVESIKVLLVP
jgi:threonine dehydrogenase-like Zn-dependent dehydrogenase